MAKTVMVFGTFDAIHPGHLHLFSQAKKHGSFLIVVVARDKTVATVKGHRSTHAERDRRALVGAVRLVDKAVLGDVRDQMRVIRQYRPDVVCLGYDQVAFVDSLKKTFPALKIIRLKAYRPDVYKSSKLKLK